MSSLVETRTLKKKKKKLLWSEEKIIHSSQSLCRAAEQSEPFTPFHRNSVRQTSLITGGRSPLENRAQKEPRAGSYMGRVGQCV